MKALKGKCIHVTDKIINIVLQRSLQKKKKTLLLNGVILLVLLLNIRVTGVVLNLSSPSVARSIIDKYLVHALRVDGLN